MRHIDLDGFRQWFDRYCSGFLTDDPDDRRNIELKIFHTRRVEKNAGLICSAEGFDEPVLLLSQSAGLLHDVGRFPQYAQYRTFRDSISVNHGKLGVDVIERDGLLSILPQDERDAILNAVHFHNAFSAPRMPDQLASLLLRITRDSDKLDIWNIFCEIDELDAHARPSAATLGLPELPSYSEEVLGCIRDRRLATLGTTSTLNDFRLMQLSWVFDLNFPSSFKIFSEGGFIDRYLAHLPATEDILDAAASLKAYVAEMAEHDRIAAQRQGVS